MKEPLKNVVDISVSHSAFKNPAFSYSVSGRWAEKKAEILKYLQFYYIYINVV